MCGSGDEDLGNLCCPLMPDANALLWERGFLSANGLRRPYLSCMVFSVLHSAMVGIGWATSPIRVQS